MATRLKKGTPILLGILLLFLMALPMIVFADEPQYKPLSIQDVKIEDVINYEGNLNFLGNYESTPTQMTVTTTDGVYSGSWGTVTSSLYQTYGYMAVACTIRDGQIPGVPWTVGTYDAVMTLGGQDYSYHVVIKDNPITNITVNEALVAYQGFSVNTITSAAVLPSVTVETVDGTFTGSQTKVCNELKKQYGVSFNNKISVPFGELTPLWEVGTHQATLSIAGKTVDFSVEVKANPIISLKAGDLTIFEGDGYQQKFIYDEETQSFQEKDWLDYSAQAVSLTVETIDGTVSGNTTEVLNSLAASYNNGQFLSLICQKEITEPWEKPGDYNVSATLCGVSTNFQVHIIANPIKSIEAEDVGRYFNEGWGKGINTLPHIVNVKTADGTFTGTIAELEKILSERYGRSLITNINIPTSDPMISALNFAVGSYPMTYRLFGKDVKYTFNVIESPEMSVMINDVAVVVDDSMLNENTGYYFGNDSCKIQNLAITINGKRFEGTPAEVQEKIYESEKVWVNILYYNLIREDYLSNSSWQTLSLGVNEIPVKIGGIETTYKLILKDAKSSLPFYDVKDTDWFYGDVEFAFNRTNKNNTKLMSGMNETTFGPTLPISRAQFAVMLYRFENEPETSYQAIFPDVQDGEFYSISAVWANQAGVIKGYKEGNFGPADNITREQLATIFYRYAAEYLKMDVSEAVNKGDLSQFTDAQIVSDFAKDALQWANGAGIISGKEGKDGTRFIDPQGSAARAECAAMFRRFIAYLEQ